MSKSQFKSTAVIFLATAAILLMTTARQAQARPQYLPWWIETYPDVAKSNNVAKMVKCGVCHMGASKKNRNEYGKAITKALGDKKNVRGAAGKTTFGEVLSTVEKEKNGAGKTFGELLKDGQLPVPSK